MRSEIVRAGFPPPAVRVGGPNPYENLVAVAHFLDMSHYNDRSTSFQQRAPYAIADKN